MGIKTIENLFEAGLRLEISTSLVLSAAVLYHKVQEKVQLDNTYDQNVLAAGALLCSSKMLGRPINIEDMVNVYHQIIYCNSKISVDKPDLRWEYFMSGLKMAECFMFRASGFACPRNLPMSHLLCYLKAIHSSMPTSVLCAEASARIAKTCWGILQEFHKTNICVRHRPQDLAISAIIMGLAVHMVNLQGYSYIDWDWAKHLVPDFTNEKAFSIFAEVAEVYSECIPNQPIAFNDSDFFGQQKTGGISL